MHGARKTKYEFWEEVCEANEKKENQFNSQHYQQQYTINEKKEKYQRSKLIHQTIKFSNYQYIAMRANANL